MWSRHPTSLRLPTAMLELATRATQNMPTIKLRFSLTTLPASPISVLALVAAQASPGVVEVADQMPKSPVGSDTAVPVGEGAVLGWNFAKGWVITVHRRTRNQGRIGPLKQSVSVVLEIRSKSWSQ